ncbi:8-amino-7-oxononanoate synthase [Xenorhabdus bovienii]|uniref:8-amino-7-oxononanoate synthase n=1 Tax=Xenorhabdus bovienii TaxID=40576 RepID=A0AAJ1J8J8_XENBV|nr:8-amino-7-oxononanoate synthase [Xenorhabdus bovienii]MDE1479130.1 8-amino-7-oxononanoate synthase [Xenorhabdus bovienii]MDE1490370.1 8-amino-7-oxononanoate synthase [Xenorhabdus bovienii]MDE9510805.1 8-amino-7-oxononanoate synthase [Xenorhabdus bovienii]MDE9516553.1 8-amino-7-oxononanoate synthase [Xenorhabdus bovienii]MDE9522442.1 8-amino-7-oxononanoate synthase [Xenorhabdus bovienii]
MNWSDTISRRLTERRGTSLWRSRQVHLGSDGRLLHTSDGQYLNFSSNDYLGLSQHPQIIAAWQQGAEQYGVGSGGSGHVTGYTAVHHTLEQQLAEWLGYSRALLFISGYAANQGVIAALMEKDDRIIADRLSHASLIEAAMHSPAQLRRFLHNDPNSLKQHLAKDCAGKTLVVTEGIFSMDGDCAPLASLAQQTKSTGSWLMVDDAHGIGIHGEQGRGSCWAQNVKPEILIVTFGKAFGLSGAAVLCDEQTAEYLIQYARHLIYSTSMPPAQAVALSEAVRQIKEGDELRQRLQNNIRYFRREAYHLPFTLMDSETAIQPLIIGDNERCIALSHVLRQQKVWVKSILPPTVPLESARLRITLTASHTQQDIEILLEALHGSGC